jgi:glycine oxidase
VDSADVVIAGAGIIGLSLALDLASHGLRVTVLERARAMAEASSAAAGMLAASDPENPSLLHPLAQLSLRLYPGYLTRIEQLSARKVPLRTRSALVATSAGHSFPTGTHRPSLQELRSLVPDLQPGSHHFQLIDESSLDPRDLAAALPLAAAAAGVQLREQTPVLSIDAEIAGIVVQTTLTSIAATHFVNCAGAWAESPALGRLPRNHPRIAPSKGQMALVRLRGAAALHHVLRTPEIYLVPRGDGRIVIGATVERAGFDKAVEPQAIAALLRTAAEIFPPIAAAEVLESWAGLRPGSADDLPLIGPSSRPHTWIASGHFRNGILLAPGTARLLSQAIRGETPEIDLAPFNPARIDPGMPRPLDRYAPSPSDNPSTPAL